MGPPMKFILGCLIATVIGCGGPGSSRAEPEPRPADPPKKAQPPVNAPPSSDGESGRAPSPPPEGAPDTPPPGSLEILAVEAEGMIKAGDAKNPRAFQLKDPGLAKLLEVGEWVLPAKDGSTVKALLHFSYKAGKSGGMALEKPAEAKPAGARDTGRRWTSSASPSLKGRMGRIVIEYPGKDKGSHTRYDVYRGEEAAEGGYGSESVELLPGAYKVVIAGKTLAEVPVTAKEETRILVGLLKVELEERGTRWDLYDEDGKTALIGGYGSYEVGLPTGRYIMEIYKVRVPVKIEEGKITGF
jgi:hypothetical protein